ncbi:MAG: Crp/Fnr family transcriptional regulator [Candidatus Fimivicinus sp.]|nr:Crp/Fnr family transcriptional regulator [Oscillospiraceae bacterium]MDY5590957.1 Crp/Fnr family transcriptional regulator [Candidatus Fimivicinus sp.]
MKRDQVEAASALLARSPIFWGADSGSLKQYLLRSGASFQPFERGESICLPGTHNDSLGMLVAGSAQVSKGSANHHVLMSTLQEGDLFGAVTLYGTHDYFVTRITARACCTVLFLTKALVDEMILQNPRFARQYIAYLSDRIYFLNSKIDAFTGGSAESRLAAYLIANLVQDRDKTYVRMHTSMNQLTQSLDIARASLYRAFEQLEKAGAIRREGRMVSILNLQKLRECCEG